jgi:hypothetical protein
LVIISCLPSLFWPGPDVRSPSTPMGLVNHQST